MGNFLELALKRQSTRKYKNDPVAEESILKCIEAASLAPSACNSQPWFFVIIRDQTILKKLCEANGGKTINSFFKEVPVVVAVIRDSGSLLSKFGGMVKGKDYSYYDVGAAIENFCLQAADLDLGTCIVGWFDEKATKDALKIPSNKRVELLIALGHPSEGIRNKKRKEGKDLFSFDSYR